MLTAIILLATISILTCLLLRAKDNKLVFAVLISIGLCSTVYFCISKPALHKPFSVSVIDYLIKFNTDGSMTTTKHTTTTVIKEGKE